MTGTILHTRGWIGQSRFLDLSFDTDCQCLCLLAPVQGSDLVPECTVGGKWPVQVNNRSSWSSCFPPTLNYTQIHPDRRQTANWQIMMLLNSRALNMYLYVCEHQQMVTSNQCCPQNKQPLGGTLTYFTSIIIASSHTVQWAACLQHVFKENKAQHTMYPHTHPITNHIYTYNCFMLLNISTHWQWSIYEAIKSEYLKFQKSAIDIWTFEMIQQISSDGKSNKHMHVSNILINTLIWEMTSIVNMMSVRKYI